MIDPIRRSVVVTCSPAKAFEVFTAKMDGWWPLRVHSRAADRREDSVKAERIVLEPWVGGRLFEVSLMTVWSFAMEPRDYAALTVLIKVR